MLDQGLLLLDRIMNTNSSDISEKAFELYDTYGPVDLTNLILNENNINLIMKVFKIQLEKQKKRSRAASEISTDDWTVLGDDDEQEFIDMIF